MPASWYCLIASTEIRETSTERFDTQLFGSGKPKGVALSGRFYTHLLQKDIEKKVNLMELSQDAKNCFDLANLTLIS